MFYQHHWELSPLGLLAKTNFPSLCSPMRWEFIYCLSVIGWYCYTAINHCHFFTNNICEVSICWDVSVIIYLDIDRWERMHMCGNGVHLNAYVYSQHQCAQARDPNKMGLLWFSALVLMRLLILGNWHHEGIGLLIGPHESSTGS